MGNSNTIESTESNQSLGSFTFLAGAENQLSENVKNVAVFGNDNTLTQCNDVFVNGSGNSVSGDSNIVLGNGNLASGRNMIMIGEFATSDFNGGSVINDGRLTPTDNVTSAAKTENSLFLDFEKGTHLNLPLGTSDNTNSSDGVPGSVMYSGEFLLIKTGNAISSAWGKIQISAI